MAGDRCDVCDREGVVGVASSSLGAVSWAFCKECLQKPAEPECMFCYLYEDVSDKGEGLIAEINSMHTFQGGVYVSWPDYVKQRHCNEAK
jgi:hypothetical protein